MGRGGLEMLIRVAHPRGCSDSTNSSTVASLHFIKGSYEMIRKILGPVKTFTPEVKAICLFLIVLLIGGCSSSGDDSTSENENILVSGFATTEEPIVGATVSLYSPDGELIVEFPEETQTKGTFIVSVPRGEMQDGYRIKVTGGTLASGNPFTETLRAVGTADDEGIVHVGYASTLLAGYMDRHPDIYIEAAKSKIAEFLEIPDTIDLQRDLFYVQKDFSDAVFAAESSRNGGIGVFTETLLDEIDADEQNVYSFAAPPSTQSLKSEVAKELLKGLAKGVGSEVGGDAAGWVLNSIFGGSDSPSAPTDPAVLSAMDQIGEQIHELQGILISLESTMQKELEKIVDLLEYDQYSKRIKELDNVSGVDHMPATLETLEDKLYLLCSYDKKDSVGWKQMATDTKKEIGQLDLQKYLTICRSVLGGEIGKSSAIELWGKMQTKEAIDEQRHDLLFEHFQYYANLQLTALNLLIEKNNSIVYPDDKDFAETVNNGQIDKYKNGIKHQSEIFLKWVEVMMVQTLNTTLFGDHPLYENDVHGRIDGILHGGTTVQPSDSYESPTLMAADKIVADFMGGEEALVVRLAIPDMENETSLISKVNLKLVNLSTGVEYPNSGYETRTLSQNSVFMPALAYEQVDDWSYDGFGKVWHISRYTFPDLPYGTYALVNQNTNYPHPGGSGYPSLYNARYLQETIPMAADSIHNLFVLAYTPMAQ